MFTRNIFRAITMPALVLAAAVSCGKDEDTPTPTPTPATKVECVLTVHDGSLSADGTVEKEPYASLLVTNGEDVEYTVCYSVDEGSQTRLAGVHLDIARKLDISGHTSKGQHTVSGYVFHDLDSCRFEGIYKMTAAVQADSVIYDTPQVTLTVRDTIPASGGEVSTGDVTYRQKCTVFSAGARRDTVLTSGGKVTFAGAVSAPSRGKQEGGARVADSLRVSVTMNGKTGSAAAAVIQAANSRSVECDDPLVSLKVTTDIPAGGGSLSEGTVSYTQNATCKYDSGEQEQVTVTTGGDVIYGDPVTAPSLGVTITERKQVGTLTVTVTLNGHSGEASAQVWQQANREEKLVLSPGSCTLTIGGKQTISARTEYTSGDNESAEPTLTAGMGLSLSGKTITATSCSQSGTETQVTGRKGDLTATMKVTVNPRYESMRYNGPSLMYLGQEYTYTIDCRCVCQMGSIGTLLDLTDIARVVCDKGGIVGVGAGYIHPIAAGKETVKFIYYTADISITTEMEVRKP